MVHNPRPVCRLIFCLTKYFGVFKILMLLLILLLLLLLLLLITTTRAIEEVPGEGPCKNSRCLSSPKDKKCHYYCCCCYYYYYYSRFLGYLWKPKVSIKFQSWEKPILLLLLLLLQQLLLLLPLPLLLLLLLLITTTRAIEVVSGEGLCKNSTSLSTTKAKKYY